MDMPLTCCCGTHRYSRFRNATAGTDLLLHCRACFRTTAMNEHSTCWIQVTEKGGKELASRPLHEFGRANLLYLVESTNLLNFAMDKFQMLSLVIDEARFSNADVCQCFCSALVAEDIRCVKQFLALCGETLFAFVVIRLRACMAIFASLHLAPGGHPLTHVCPPGRSVRSDTSTTGPS